MKVKINLNPRNKNEWIGYKVGSKGSPKPLNISSLIFYEKRKIAASWMNDKNERQELLGDIKGANINNSNRNDCSFKIMGQKETKFFDGTIDDYKT